MDLKKRAKKGQAAIEYLMTYGWALLVIAIVIVVLYMITQTQTKTEQCLAPVGFVCNDPLPQFHGSVVDLRLQNKQLQGITGVGAYCSKTQDPGPNPTYTACTGTGASGSYVDCKNVPCAAQGMAAGQSFSGYLVIKYNYMNDISSSPRVLVLSVSGTSAPNST